MPDAPPQPTYRQKLIDYALFAAVTLAVATLFGLTSRWTGIPGVAVQPPPPPPQAGPQSAAVDYEGCPYEAPGFHVATPDGPQHAEGDGRPWPQRRITYWIDFRETEKLNPPVSRDAIRQAFRQAWLWWADGVEIEPVEVPTEGEALVRHRFGTIDGGLGTLAWSYLSDGTLRPKEQKYDVAERWTPGAPAANLLSMPAVMAHEIGHVLGLGHDDPAAPALMRPSYSASIPREQPRDVARLVALGYAAKPKPPAPPPGEFLTFPVQARTADVIDSLKKAGYTVTK